MVRILESVSKSENSAKSSVVIASSVETLTAKENAKKLNKILKKISKLNLRLLDVAKLHKQANKLPKSDFVPWMPSFL